MSDYDELRDALAPAGQPMPAHSLTAAEVRKLGSARLHRRQAGRAGVGALAVASVIGLVALDPMGFSHDHRGGAALGSPSHSAVASSTWSATPRVIPSSAASGVRASGASSTPFTPTETAVAPTAATPPVGTVCTAQNAAWTAAFTRAESAAEGTTSSYETAAGYAERTNAGGENSTLTWYPGGDRSRGQVVATFTGADNDGMTVVTDDVIVFNRSNQLWLWDHQTLRQIASPATLGEFTVEAGVVYYVGSDPGAASTGSPQLQLHRLSFDGSDTRVPNVDPNGRLDHGFYTTVSSQGIKVTDLTGIPKTVPPGVFDSGAQIVGAHDGQPVFQQPNALVYYRAAEGWTNVGSGGTVLSAAVVGDNLLWTVPGRVIGLSMKATGKAPEIAFPVNGATTERPTISASGSPAVLIYSVRPGDIRAESVVHTTPVSSLPDLQGC